MSGGVLSALHSIDSMTPRWRDSKPKRSSSTTPSATGCDDLTVEIDPLFGSRGETRPYPYWTSQELTEKAPFSLTCTTATDFSWPEGVVDSTRRRICTVSDSKPRSTQF